MNQTMFKWPHGGGASECASAPDVVPNLPKSVNMLIIYPIKYPK